MFNRSHASLLRGALLATIAALSACSASSPARAGRPAEALAVVLDQSIRELFGELSLVPGMAVAVVRDTTTLYLGGFGVADVSSSAQITPETGFYIASSTKSFTGLAAAILEHRGIWNLDDPLSRWLPGARLPAPLSAERVTLRQLLTHTSRVDNDEIVFRTAYSGEHDPATLVGLLASSEVRDSGFAYGNIGYVVASLAMDQLGRGSWKDILQDLIFDPLAMKRTGARRSALAEKMLAQPHGIAVGESTARFEVRRYIKTDANMHAAGGIISTAADLARWLQVNLNDGRLDGRQALPAAAVRESHRKQAETDARFYRFARRGYGLGWYHGDYEGDLLMHHFGNYPGFRAHVSFMPAHRVGVAVLTNESSQGYFVPEAVASLIYDRLLGKPDLARRRDSVIAFLRADAARVRESLERDAARRALRPDTLAFPLGAYTGTFVNREAGTMRITSSRGHLHAAIGVLSGVMEPVDGRAQLRVELVPGSGDLVNFFMSGGFADSLDYGGEIFRRTSGRP